MIVMKRPLATLALASLTLAACGTSSADSGGAAPSAETVAVTAAFYPLAYAVERVGGERVCACTVQTRSS